MHHARHDTPPTKNICQASPLRARCKPRTQENHTPNDRTTTSQLPENGVLSTPSRTATTNRRTTRRNSPFLTGIKFSHLHVTRDRVHILVSRVRRCRPPPSRCLRHGSRGQTARVSASIAHDVLPNVRREDNSSGQEAVQTQAPAIPRASKYLTTSAAAPAPAPARGGAGEEGE